MSAVAAAGHRRHRFAVAVEEQGAATAEISRNIRQPAVGASNVSANIREVNCGAGQIGAASTHVLASARPFAGESSRLKGEVAKFLSNVRAA